jgi:transposase
MKDYTGKTVFIGADVHKKTYSLTCICEDIKVKQNQIKATPESLVNYINKYFKGACIKTVYEAGFSGFGLHRHLLAAGIESMVVHAASVEISARDRVKTDKRDSLKLATQLSAGRLKGIHVPSKEREAARELSRLREKFSADKRRVGNRLKSLLMRQGLLDMDNDQKISEKWLKTVVLKYESDESISFCIKHCIENWLDLKRKIKEIEAELAAQAKADEELERVYRSAPGIGKVHARVLANELEDMRHFSNEKHLSSFTGLTPSEHSSGEYKRLGHISRQGRSLVRKTLILAAWQAIKKDPSLQITFEGIAARVGKKRAIVAIARKLIGRIRSCFKSNTLYQSRFLVNQETGEVFAG